MPDLKLEAGKFYRTRDGRKVGPARLHNEAWNHQWPWTCGDIPTYRDDGFAVDPAHPRNHDVVAEWPDESASKHDDTLNLRLDSSPEMRQAVALEKIADALSDIADLLAARPIATGATVRSDQQNFPNPAA